MEADEPYDDESEQGEDIENVEDDEEARKKEEVWTTVGQFFITFAFTLVWLIISDKDETIVKNIYSGSRFCSCNCFHFWLHKISRRKF